MARDREQIYEASDWFKEALQKNQVCCNCVGVIMIINQHKIKYNFLCISIK